MLIIRLIGWIFVLAALIVLLIELRFWLSSGEWELIPIGQLWYQLHAESLNIAQAIIQRYLHPSVWDPWIVAILLTPGWPTFSTIGAVIIILCRVTSWRPER
ncbi:MAG: hypothetical protein VXY05_04015 [Pseudomonadota bacterium]|jgi:hypothetical protein|nr:hypothetical protein [Pseudomonadota bacterium]MEC9078044.1 hypothetical protein [Pseudomonadota bacterium]